MKCDIPYGTRKSELVSVITHKMISWIHISGILSRNIASGEAPPVGSAETDLDSKLSGPLSFP